MRAEDYVLKLILCQLLFIKRIAADVGGHHRRQNERDRREDKSAKRYPSLALLFTSDRDRRSFLWLCRLYLLRLSRRFRRPCFLRQAFRLCVIEIIRLCLRAVLRLAVLKILLIFFRHSKPLPFCSYGNHSAGRLRPPTDVKVIAITHISGAQRKARAPEAIVKYMPSMRNISKNIRAYSVLRI